MTDSERNPFSPPAASRIHKRALVIFNKASRKAGEQMENAIAQLDRHDDIDVTVADCPAPGQLSQFIVERRTHCDLVVLGGGDGTMNAAARGLIEAQVPLGILPLGTANDLARTLGIPEDLETATKIIINGNARRIDLGEVNGRPFFNVASIGLSADLASELSSDLKKRFGKIGYAIAAISVLLRARPFRATIMSGDKKVRALTLQIAVGNGLFYGGGMAIERDAKIDDGTLDLYSLEMRRAWKLALMAKAFRFGDHGAWREVRVDHAQAFHIRTRRRHPINADGEIVSHTPADFRILPRAIEVLTAPGAPGITNPEINEA
jgi:diacylglycerol kinase (ATP)